MKLKTNQEHYLTLKNALMEAADWDIQATEEEKTKISYMEAKDRILDRIFKKYYNDLI